MDIDEGIDEGEFDKKKIFFKILVICGLGSPTLQVNLERTGMLVFSSRELHTQNVPRHPFHEYGAARDASATICSAFSNMSCLERETLQVPFVSLSAVFLVSWAHEE